jgi:phosphinothricin acetyltransferase
MLATASETTKELPVQITIRPAVPADGRAVSRVYEPYVRDTAVTFEEVPPTGEEMARRITETLPRHPYLVAADATGEVIGYAYAGPHAARASYRWSVSVAIYLDAKHHGRGVGRRLYERLLPMVAAQGYVMAFAGVTLPNEKSVGIHERFGFKPVAVYHNVGHKHGRWLDVGWWEKPLTDRLPATPHEPRPWIWTDA